MEGLVSAVFNTATNQKLVEFLYDEFGQRLKKTSYIAGAVSLETWYVMDAVYEKPPGGTLAQAEITIPGGVFQRQTATYQYTLSDHLGNARVVISRSTTTVRFTGDYYPFGWGMPGRSSNDINFRYGYQGQEQDAETRYAAFELRMWDGRIGRWMSPDPYGQYSSPYLGMGNVPNLRIDPNGGIDWPSIGAAISGFFNRVRSKIKSFFNKFLGGSDKAADDIPETAITQSTGSHTLNRIGNAEYELANEIVVSSGNIPDNLGYFKTTFILRNGFAFGNNIRVYGNGVGAYAAYGHPILKAEGLYDVSKIKVKGSYEFMSTDVSFIGSITNGPAYADIEVPINATSNPTASAGLGPIGVNGSLKNYDINLESQIIDFKAATPNYISNLSSASALSSYSVEFSVKYVLPTKMNLK